MTQSKQTAVDILKEFFDEYDENYEAIKLALDKAKKIEKIQIIEAWNLSRRDIDYSADGKQYYDMKYKKK